MIKNAFLPNTTATPESAFSKLVGGTISLLVIIGIIFFVITLILGGIKWIGSSGDEKKLAMARLQITNAFIGLIIVMGVFAIVKLIGVIFGLPSLQLLNIQLPRLN